MRKSENSYAHNYTQAVWIDWQAIPHTTVGKHTQVYHIALLQHCIPPTWRR